MSNTLQAADTQFNFLKNHQFQLVIPRLPNVSFYTINTGIPAMSVGSPMLPTPFKGVPVVGESADFDDFSVTFLVDHKLNNYYEVYDWLRGYSRVNDTQNMMDYISRNQGNPEKAEDKSLTSDIQFLILADKGCEVARVEFKYAFPVSLSGLDVTTQVQDVEYLTATAVFKYAYYEIVR